MTEGGIATALAELSQAGGRGMRIRRDKLPVYPQTRRMGEILGIDPLGLIGSGSLLICCRPDCADRLLSEMEKAGIMATDIGVVTEAGPGIDAVEKETRWVGRILMWTRSRGCSVNPNVAKAGGLESQGVKGEAVIDYRDPLTTRDLKPSRFPGR